MKVTVDKIAPSPNGLVLGLQVRGPDDSWVRFVQATLPWSAIPPEWLQDYWRHWDRAHLQEDLGIDMRLF